MLASLLSSFLVVIAVTGFLRLAKRYLPAPPAEAGRPELSEMEGLEKASKSWTRLVFVLLIVFAVAAGICWFFLFCALGDYVMKPGPDVIFQIDPRHFSWCVPAFFMGIISGGILSEHVLRWLAGTRYTALKRYSQAKSGIDGTRLMRWTVPLAVLPALAFVVCQVCDVTRFSSSGVTLGHFGGFSHPVYSYDQVKALRFFPLTLDSQGHVKDRPEFQMEFKDGMFWSTESLFRDISPSYDRRAFEYVATRSGVSIATLNRTAE